MSTARERDTDVGGERGRTPDCYLVGQPKSGTTALFEILRQHPQIFIPDRKEPRFFAQELFDRDPPRPGGTPKTLAEYRTWFADARDDQRVMDASPWYLWSPTSAQRIAAARPDAQIIVVLREPASLLRSLHLQLVQLYVEAETDFQRALELEERRRRGEEIPRHTYWPAMLMYSDHVRYVQELSRYAEHFPPEQMKILIYDDWRADNAGAVREVLRFLRVDEDVPLELREANPTVQVRSRHMHEMVHAVSVGHGPVSKAAKAAVKAVTPGGWRRQALYSAKRKFVFTEPDPVDDRFLRELRERYRGEVEALGEYLGRDMLSLWGYAPADGS
ncbi:MAG TPA: sulfotransferase [Solirubrobacteraceae bacterium]|nr:sulfotransferase [Solirubrobacteraceae bacterium]